MKFKFFSLSRKVASLSTVARRSFYISVAFHLLLVFAAGAFVISHVFYNRESTFTGQPPPIKAYEPRKLEFKVKVSKRQRSSSRPAMAPRLVSSKLNTGLSLPDIKMDSKLIKTSFQPRFKAVGGSGLGMGVGLGTGYGLGGFGAGVSSFNFFGIQGSGERVAVLVDVSVSMVEEEKGGATGFMRVKNRINKVIDALNPGSLFNVIVFADAASTFEKAMVVANDENKSKAKIWLRPFNTEANWGLTSGNLSARNTAVSAVGGTTRLDIALTAAFEMGADTILVLSDGLPRVKKGLSAEDIKAQQAKMAEWALQNPVMPAAPAAPAAPVVTRQVKVWVGEIPAQPAQPAIPPRPPSKRPPKEGQAPDMGDPGRPAIPAQPGVQGHWETQTITEGGGGGGGGGPQRPPPPPPIDPGWWTLSDFARHLQILYDESYKKKGKKVPIIHSIGYQIDKDGGDFLNALSKQYKGKFHRVARID